MKKFMSDSLAAKFSIRLDKADNAFKLSVGEGSWGENGEGLWFDHADALALIKVLKKAAKKIAPKSSVMDDGPF